MEIREFKNKYAKDNGFTDFNDLIVCLIQDMDDEGFELHTDNVIKLYREHSIEHIVESYSKDIVNMTNRLYRNKEFISEEQITEQQINIGNRVNFINMLRP